MKWMRLKITSLPDLAPLLTFLSTRPASAAELNRWRIKPVGGGWNNLLYHACGPEGDFAIKFSRRDARDRAGREFAALALLKECAPGLAPEPVLLDRDCCPLPVVVQAWIEGETSAILPSTLEDWRALAEHYAAIHDAAIEPSHGPFFPEIRPAALTFDSAIDAVQYVLKELASIPEAGWTPGLRRLAARFEERAGSFPRWSAPPHVFCRSDPNILNIFRHAHRPWQSVDWENSGWGDPAFELGDLLAHPCYKTASPEHIQAFMDACAALHPGDPTFMTRVRTYYAIIIVRWTGIFARYWYQRDHLPPDSTRLAQAPAAWWHSLPDEHARCLTLAEQALT